MNSAYSGGAKYPGGISGSGRGIFFNHHVLRQNARTAYFDVPQVKALVDRFADTTVDIGLMLEATPRSNILGISDEQAENWSRDVQERFHMWAEDKKSHRSEINNFYQNQRSSLHPSKNASLLYRLAILLDHQADDDLYIRSVCLNLIFLSFYLR